MKDRQKLRKLANLERRREEAELKELAEISAAALADSFKDDDTVIYDEEPVERHDVVSGVKWPTEVVDNYHTAIDGDN